MSWMLFHEIALLLNSHSIFSSRGRSNSHWEREREKKKEAAIQVIYILLVVSLRFFSLFFPLRFTCVQFAYRIVFASTIKQWSKRNQEDETRTFSRNENAQWINGAHKKSKSYSLTTVISWQTRKYSRIMAAKEMLLSFKMLLRSGKVKFISLLFLFSFFVSHVRYISSVSFSQFHWL